MALFVATKARILVTVATAGALVAGVAGLQAQAREAATLAENSAAQASETTTVAPAPTPTATKKKKKKKKKTVAVVVQAPVVQKQTTKTHGTSSGSK